MFRPNRLLVVTGIALVLVGVVAFLRIGKTDPGPANAALARLRVPAGWELAESQEDPSLLVTSSVTRYYLARGDPESVTREAREMLSAAGYPVEDTIGLSDCSSNHEPPRPSAPCPFR